MSIGIGGKVFGKGFELFVGKKAYSHTLTFVRATIIAIKHRAEFVSLELLTLEVAIRW